MLLERHCLALREDVEHLSERQEVLAILMEGNMNMQKAAPEDFQRQIFEELRELEEQKTKEALELVQRKHQLFNWEGERDRARTLRQEQEDSGPELTTIPLLVRADPPCPLKQTKQCLLPQRWLWKKGRKETDGALTWRVKWRSWK